MEGCPDAVKEAINRETAWFEEKVLGCTAQSLSLYKQVRNIVCRDPARHNEYTQDFQTRLLNPAYEAVSSWNEIQLEHSSGIFRPIPIDYARIFLKTQSDSGKLLSMSDLEDVIAALEKAISSTNVDDALPLVKKGIAYWLKLRKTNQVKHQLSLADAVSLDALSLELEYNLNAIRDMESAGTSAFADMPDRFTVTTTEDLRKLSTATKENVDAILAAAQEQLKQVRPPGKPLKSQIPGLNAAMGGGFFKGDGYLFIAPTGAGKTVCACQLAMNFIGLSGSSSLIGQDLGKRATFENQGFKGMLITTEEPHERLIPRMASQVCNIPITALRNGIEPEKLDPMQREALAEWFLSMGDLMICNWTKKAGVSVAVDLPEELDAFYQQYGQMPDFVILDWIGGALGDNVPMEHLRLVYQNAADTFEKLAKKHKFVAVAFAQASKNANNKKRVDMEHIAECKTMGNNYSGMIGITSLYNDAIQDTDEDVVEDTQELRAEKQFFWCSKTRAGRNMSIPFRRQYLYQRQAPWK